MAMRNLLIISGNVQGVGYRTLVKQIANRLKVTGIVKNLPDGNVEIYCQSPDNEAFDKFKKKIEIKATTDNVFAVHVDSINSYKEEEPDYGEPDTDFKTFIIDYGMDVDQFQRESLERSEIGILLLGGTISEVGGVRSEIKDMHSDMNDRFDTLDEKYGAISQQMNVLTTELQKSTNSLVSLTEKIGALIDDKLSE